MNWNTMLRMGLISEDSICQLIIVGETSENLPFCYEDQFIVKTLDEQRIVVALPFKTINPLDHLQKVSFIEFSFVNNGVLYYTFVELLSFDVKKQTSLLTLSAPEELLIYEHRKYKRIQPPTYTPITGRIVGVRGKKTHEGVSFHGDLIEISGNGLSFVTATRLFYPLFLQLNFMLPNHPTPFQIYGEILRVSHFGNDSYRVAVKFNNVSENTVNEINQYGMTI